MKPTTLAAGVAIAALAGLSLARVVPAAPQRAPGCQVLRAQMDQAEGSQERARQPDLGRVEGRAEAGDDREQNEKALLQALEHLLARLRAAATDREKQRLERAIVELVRAELRGTWLAVAFTLESVDVRKNTIRVTLAGTTLLVDGLLLAKDAKVWIDGQTARPADLQAGMRVALQLEAEAKQPRILGVRASNGGPAGAAAAELDQLIRQLGSNKFAEREAASKALEALGRSARHALGRAAASGDAEVSNRARRLLRALARKEGTWYCSLHPGDPPNPALACFIEEADGKLRLINEHGDRTEATVRLNGHHLEVIAWGMIGQLETDREGTRIRWPNGTTWTQKRPGGQGPAGRPPEAHRRRPASRACVIRG
jgi:hypothetical protein